MEDEDDIHGKIGDLIRFGTIMSVDLGTGTATVQCGDVTSPALHWTEWAGAFRTWSPPSIDEQVVLICPEGDIAGGVILRGVFSSTFPKAGSGPDPQLHGPDGLIITLTGDGIQIVAPGGLTIDGDVTVTGTVAASVDVTGAGISLKSHRHGGVQGGPAQTGLPA